MTVMNEDFVALSSPETGVTCHAGRPQGLAGMHKGGSGGGRSEGETRTRAFTGFPQEGMDKASASMTSSSRLWAAGPVSHHLSGGLWGD